MLFRLAIAAAAIATCAFGQDGRLEHFEKKIRPVLASRCYPCHSSAIPAPQGGLLLDSASGIRKGGNTGAALQPGDPDQSLLVRAIRFTDKNLKMPPGKALPPEVVADFEEWVRAGATLPSDEPVVSRSDVKLWSLRPPVKADPPSVRNSSAVRNEIDRFVLSRLESKGLSFSPQADKRALIRRVTWDLTGLPASASEVEAFLNDSSPRAWEQLVDRLLASPRYGERWARHWLDVARYADSFNDSVNAGQRYAWSYTYRDWVIASLNEDLPYDKFVLYQLAADKVHKVEPRHLAALGFLSLGREFPNSYPETVDDRIDAVSRGLLGITVACARCHDHKYDPVPTKDYYSFYSILSNLRQPPDLPVISDAAAAPEKEAVYRKRLDNIRNVLQDYRTRRNAEMVAFFKTQIAEYLLAVRDSEGLSNPDIEELVRDRQLNLHMLRRWRKFLESSRKSDEPVFRLWHAAAALPEADYRSKWPEVSRRVTANQLIRAALQEKPAGSLKELASLYAATLNHYDSAASHSSADAEQLRAVMRGPASPADVPVEEFESIYTEGDSNNTRSIKVRYNAMLALAAYDGAKPRAMSVEDVPDPAPVHVFVRGNPNNPGALAPPQFLSCLGGNAFDIKTSRLDLARSIIDSSNPLTARVIVNRVWMHHFGSGLVRTPSDFGFRGDQPTHPELLDYLAVKFVQSGWSLKKLHRMILTSAAYMQSSTHNETAAAIDPENLLLWRMNRRRLDIESLRDFTLAAAGRLDLTVGGVPFPLTAQPSVPRRSVYAFIERGRIPGVLNAFDFASPDQHAPMRYVTTVPQQALFFLNSPFVAEQARHIAARPEIAGASTPAEKIGRMYRAIFSRDAAGWEVQSGLRYIASKTNDSAQSPPSPWQYGYGAPDSFVPFSTFVDDRWQGAAVLPAGRSGTAVLSAAGGEPGEEPHQAVIRRWVSPVSGRVTIEGTLRHGQPAVPYGDGVRGRVISSRLGELASYSVNGSSAETKLNGIAVEPGDTLDFVVDGRRDPENDRFGWAPVVRLGEKSWTASAEFAGPGPEPLDVWARYAQVLLSTNEFAFVD